MLALPRSPGIQKHVYFSAEGFLNVFDQEQLRLLTSERPSASRLRKIAVGEMARFMHPNGQLPAYEWNFNDVNPPVHARDPEKKGIKNCDGCENVAVCW